MRQKQMNVCITGANGNIAYSFYNYLCCGHVLSPDTYISLRLLEVASKKQQLEILKLELEDCCYKKVTDIQIFTSENESDAFKDADLIVFLGGSARKPGMEISEVYEENAQIFRRHGINMNNHAKKTCKSLIVANPVNINCLVLSNNAPSIPRQNFTALTRLDYNRFIAQTTKLFECQPSEIKKAIVWGNHSRSQFCDLTQVEIEGYSKELIREKVKQLDHNEVEVRMYDRGGFMHEKKGGNMFLSATKAIMDHLKVWFEGDPDDIVSMSIILEKEVYGIKPGICFSMPVRCIGNGQYKIVDDLELTEYQKKRISDGVEEISKEINIINEYLLNKFDEIQTKSHSKIEVTENGAVQN